MQMCANGWYYVVFANIFGLDIMKSYVWVLILGLLYPVGHDLAGIFVASFRARYALHSRLRWT